MKQRKIFNRKGLTIIELLVGLVIFSIIIAATYRLFITQSRAYTVQDQVVETQQSIRSAMEILLRDLRMTGFDNDSLNSKITIPIPLIAGINDVTINYEFDDTTQYSVRYWRDGATQTLNRQLTSTKDDGTSVVSPADLLLENVEELQFNYGVDTNEDKALDSWVDAGTINGARVVAIRVRLTARPEQAAPEDQKMMSPRTLETAVTLRNLCLR